MHHLVSTAMLLMLVNTSLLLASDRPADLTAQSLLAKARTAEALLAQNVYIEAELRSAVVVAGQRTDYHFRRAKTWIRNGRVHVQRDDWPSQDEPFGDDITVDPNRTVETLWPYSEAIRGLTVNRTPPNGDPVVLAAPKRTDAEARIALATVDAGASRLRGQLHGDETSILETIAKMPLVLRSQKESIGGADCHVIDARGQYGQYTVWLDPAHGCALRRAEFTKQEDDRFYGRRLKEPDPETRRVLGATASAQTNTMKSLHTTLEILSFADADAHGARCPSSARMVSETRYADGRLYTLIEDIRQRVDTDPQLLAEHRFELRPIPDGSQVLIRGDTSDAPYEWRGGTIVKKTRQR